MYCKAAVEDSVMKFLTRTVPLSEIDAHRLVLVVEKVLPLATPGT